MAAGGLIDWSTPWLQGLPRIAVEGPVHEALNRAGAAPVRFVPQSALPPGTAYEQFIHATGTVPTRDNLHDFFNGLVWLRFPHAKLRLNQLQAQAIAADGVQAVRGPLRDALTVFDENGAVLQAPDALWDALRARDWQRLFIHLRPLWREARLMLFGHALLEKLVSPRKPMVTTVSRSCRSRILLVAWRRRATGSSSRGMPMPSSSTEIRRTPPASRRSVTWVAPASSALSTSSRTTEAGRSTTSPAAIWLMSSSGRSWMRRRAGVLSEEVIAGDSMQCRPGCPPRRPYRRPG